jgi:hypothetical protein
VSDGKASTYRVVSAEELRRRALAAAKDRLARANQSALDLGAIVTAACTTYGDLDVTVPESCSTKIDDPQAVDKVAAQLESEVALARTRAQATICSARARHVDAASADLLASLRPIEAVPELVVRSSSLQLPTAQQLENALNIVGRLPGETTADVFERCEQLVAAIGAAESTARGDVLLTALRTEVQGARERSETVARNRNELDRLYRMLDGLEGEEASSLRGYLRGCPLDDPLPGDLAPRVERVRDDAVRELDRHFALQVTREVLEEQGYALGEDFVTVVVSADGAVLPLAASRRHGVRVRERAGQLLFNVVRFDQTEADGAEDGEASTAFCKSFDAIAERAGENGLSLTEVVHFEPGSGHVEVRDEVSPFERTEAVQELEQERERRRS